MKHRGEILKQRVEESRFSIKEIADKAKLSRATIYNTFNDALASFDYIIRIGKVIKHDFSEDFDELKNPNRIEDEENLNYKIKYHELMEEHIKLLKERLEFYEKGKKKK